MTSRLRHVEGGVSADEGAPASVEHRARRTRHGARGARSRWSAAGLALTALLGPLPVAALAGVCVARFLPVAENTRFTVGITRHAEAYALLGIDPAVEQIVGFLWVGQPSRPHPAPVRPPLSAHVRTTD